MNRLPTLTLMLTASLAITANAQQEIRLKSGTTFFGVATFEGDDAVVNVGESELRFPREEIALIQGGAAPAIQQPMPEHRRLLNAALEAKLLNDATKEVVGLLAQAAQLAPDDPQVRFWYVTSLVEGGYGKAAEEALTPYREAVAKAYPGAADQLAARIEARRKLEDLPTAMVASIDRINAAAEVRPLDDDERHYQLAFRIVDQHGKPIKPSAVNVEGYASNQQLESFGDGYFIYTFTRSGGSANNPVKLTVDETGLRTEEFEAPVIRGPLLAPQEFVVHRFGDEDRVPFRVQVARHDGQPVAGARVTLRPNFRRGSGQDDAESGVTNENGVVEFSLFPFNYYLDVSAEGFKSESQSVVIGSGDEGRREISLKLYPLLTATIHTAWRITPIQGDGETTAGDGTLPVGMRGATGNDSDALMRVLRPLQVEDRLVLQFNPHTYGRYQGAGEADSVWLRALDVETEGGDESGGDAVRRKFEEIDLEDVDRYKKELEPIDFRPLPVGGHPSSQVPLKPDRILVGQLPFADMRTGRPGVLAFKLMVEGETEVALGD